MDDMIFAETGLEDFSSDDEFYCDYWEPDPDTEEYETLYTPPYTPEELSELTEVTVPEGMTDICAGAFQNCKKLVSVHLPQSLTMICNGAFRGCSALTSIDLPEGLFRIGKEAFADCASLEEIVLPEKLHYLDWDAFARSGLRSVCIPGHVHSDNYEEELGPGLNAFKDCRQLVSVHLPDGISWVGGFSGCTSLASVGIPQSVTRISASAFENCCSLTSVTFPEGLKEIGTHAFAGCSSLVSVSVPSAVEIIDDHAFRGCRSLARIDLSGNTDIGLDVFKDCTALADEDGFVILNNVLYAYAGSAAEVIIPKGVTDIWPWAFRNNECLSRVFVPDGIVRLRAAFTGCTNLTGVRLPDTLESLEIAAFEGCEKLETVILPKSLNAVGKRCFSGCKKLAPVFCSKPDGIADDAFDECGRVLWISGDIDKSKARALAGSRNIAAVIVKEGVTTIAARAFAGCTELRSVLLPDSLKEIGEFAFADCKALSFINLDPSVKTADLAFYGCESLKL